jgi:uncharacterized membrane protein YdjX (TVP38/TMEM64 family)
MVGRSARSSADRLSTGAEQASQLDFATICDWTAREMSRSRRVVSLSLLVGALVAGLAFFASLDVGTSPEDVRRSVGAAGWWGPVLFVVLFVFRSALFLPGVVLLIAGGICFGFLGGTVFGGLGLTFSAGMKFLAAHLAGREALIARLPQRWRARLAAVDTPRSARLLAVVTAYPVNPAELIHVAAILSGMSLLPFLASIGAGSLVRAGSLSFFGDSIVDGSGLALATLTVLFAAVLPLAVPRWRRTLLPRVENPPR